MSSTGSDYLRFPGSYRDLEGRVSDVVRLLCRGRPNSQFPSVVYRLLEYLNHTACVGRMNGRNDDPDLC